MSRTLLALLQLSDTALPIGGYSHSFGLETYVQQGLVCNLETATQFVEAMLAQNLRYNDAAFVSLAYDAAKNKDIDALQSLDEMCTAVKMPFEARQASIKMGIRLLKIFEVLTPSDSSRFYQKAIKEKSCTGHHCIAFGIYGQAAAIDKAALLHAFYFNAAAGYTTNCVKLVPLGQQAGQELLFNTHALIAQLVEDTLQPDLSLLGLCNPGFDLRSMQHERLYSRLYMS